MGKISNAWATASELASEGRFQEIARRSIELAYRERRALGLRRDLRIPIPHRTARIPITVRPLAGDDIPFLFPRGTERPARREKVELATRRAMLDAGVPQCFVAVDADGTPCYFQWRLDHRQNRFLQSHFPRRWFPVLREDEILLENAYTPVAFRGKGIMSEAMAIIAETGEDVGARAAITFVEVDNPPSLKACANAGFAPYTLRRERSWLAGALAHRRFEDFEPALG